MDGRGASCYAPGACAVGRGGFVAYWPRRLGGTWWRGMEDILGPTVAGAGRGRAGRAFAAVGGAGPGGRGEGDEGGGSRRRTNCGSSRRRSRARGDRGRCFGGTLATRRLGVGLRLVDGRGQWASIPLVCYEQSRARPSPPGADASLRRSPILLFPETTCARKGIIALAVSNARQGGNGAPASSLSLAGAGGGQRLARRARQEAEACLPSGAMRPTRRSVPTWPAAWPPPALGSGPAARAWPWRGR